MAVVVVMAAAVAAAAVVNYEEQPRGDLGHACVASLVRCDF